MAKASFRKSISTFPETPQWDPNSKEPWQFEFEKEPLNDEKWSCIVTAAIQAEADDEEFIQIYTQCVNTGLRKAIKIITMADIINLLTSSKKEDKNARPEKWEKAEKLTRKSLKLSSSNFARITEVAAKYAVVTDSECKLPSPLMAALIKYMILKLKEENCLQKRIEAVRERKLREQNLKAKFIRNLKPFKISEEAKKPLSKISPNFLEIDEPINDEPIGGPDLYILLTDIYDVFVFPELLSLNIPFLALFKISSVGMPSTTKASYTSITKQDSISRKKSLVSLFWEKLVEQCFDFETTSKFKTIAMMEYQAPSKTTDSKLNFYRTIFDQLTWMQYSVYCIYRQHQKYLQELQVQNLIESLEPLDLSKCEVYNKLCDALITGEPLTPLLVLYAIVEQVVAGVPETKWVTLEYKSEASDFFANETNIPQEVEKIKKNGIVWPCTKCRDKVEYKNPCQYDFKEDITTEKDDDSENTDFTIETPTSSSTPIKEEVQPDYSIKSAPSAYIEPRISESFIDYVMGEKKTEKEQKKDKTWKPPCVYFYGDSVSLQTYHCDPRILDSHNIVERFLKPHFSRIYAKYAELPRSQRAFYNFHFQAIKKISEETEERLKLKFFFALSMKLIGITKSYLYKGEEENISEMTSTGKEKVKLFKVKFGIDKNTAKVGKDEKNFNNYFFKNFIADMYVPKKSAINAENKDHLMGSSGKPDSHGLRKMKSQFSMALMVHLSSGTSYAYSYRHNENPANNSHSSKNNERIFSTLYSILDCFEISNVIDMHFPNDKDEYFHLIKDFKYYEKLEPTLMIQRLLKAQENYNTAQCTYFAPTDSVIIIMHNDFDHRGIFFNDNYGAIPTPVTLRDFYAYVYPEISEWLIDENAEHTKYMNELEEKAKAERESKDSEYLSQLTKQYCRMSEEDRKEYLETPVEITEPQVLDKELGDLPIKPKPNRPNKISFVTTNYMDVRIENNEKIHEFHSRDGTEVNVAVETWLYAPLKLLKLNIKRSKFILYYNQWLGQDETETSFTFKTNSDIIFSFCKNDSDEINNFNYLVTVSWPTGLLINVIPHNSSFYIKQNYLKPYRRGWEIEEEQSRCFIRNGQLIIFKENGDCDILTGSGARYAFNQTTGVFRYERISNTVEVWEMQTKGVCKNKRKRISSCKIYIGIDPKTQECFYKRDDGVYCMLWQNGALVTTYPDGTKITSTPYFADKEITLDWTEEERRRVSELDCKVSIQEPRSRTILRKSSSGKTTETKVPGSESFICVQCTYLMEHPKYSSVYFSASDPTVRITTLENISMKFCSAGNYEIQYETNFLRVRDSKVEFYANCNDCDDTSTATLYLDSSEILCTCVDFFQKSFTVFRNGQLSFQENCKEYYDTETLSHSKELGKSCSGLNKCVSGHNKNLALTQRCFALERDLSGIEFLHSDSLAFYCYHLPEETYFDIELDNPNSIKYTFLSPCYDVGYEKWVMDYEDKSNSLPTSIKKKDMKEMGAKEVNRNLFKYPFPKNHKCKDELQNNTYNKCIKMAKLTIVRTVRCLSPEPNSVIDELHEYVAKYQKRAKNIWNSYKNHKDSDDRSQDERYIQMRLRKIAITLNQNLQMFPHLCTQLPSTEKEIHYMGHFINFAEGLKVEDRSELLPDCKQIPVSLPRISNLLSIDEENENLQNT